MHKLSNNEIIQLTEKSYNARKNILKMMRFGEGHIGGAFSSLDVITVLYNKILSHNPQNPKWQDRDRFVLSAGHKCLALYTTLANTGYFEEDVLWTYNTFNTSVPMHPDEKMLPGIEFPTGSLGHGLPVAEGMAHVGKLDKKNYRVFAMIGDGELEEGSIWEAVMSASHYKLDNLIIIVDKNGLQVNGRTADILNSEPLEDKFRAFGCKTRRINGHDFNEIYDALSTVPFEPQKPSAIIADTIKCKGLDFGEDRYEFHHWHFKESEIDNAICKIEESCRKELCGLE